MELAYIEAPQVPVYKQGCLHITSYFCKMVAQSRHSEIQEFILKQLKHTFMNNNKFTVFSDFKHDKTKHLSKIPHATERPVAGSPTSCCVKSKKLYKIRDLINREYNQVVKLQTPKGLDLLLSQKFCK